MLDATDLLARRGRLSRLRRRDARMQARSIRRLGLLRAPARMRNASPGQLARALQAMRVDANRGDYNYYKSADRWTSNAAQMVASMVRRLTPALCLQLVEEGAGAALLANPFLTARDHLLLRDVAVTCVLDTWVGLRPWSRACLSAEACLTAGMVPFDAPLMQASLDLVLPNREVTSPIWGLAAGATPRFEPIPWRDKFQAMLFVTGHPETPGMMLEALATTVPLDIDVEVAVVDRLLTHPHATDAVWETLAAVAQSACEQPNGRPRRVALWQSYRERLRARIAHRGPDTSPWATSTLAVLDAGTIAAAPVAAVGTTELLAW